MTDGLDFVIGQSADLTARLNKKTRLIGTGAQIAASTSGLEKGKRAHCTSTGSGFIIDHDYIYNGTAWVDQGRATTSATPADTAGTTSASAVHCGFAVALTPVTTGRVLIVVTAVASEATAGHDADLQIRYGTGTAPTNGTAATGTAAGQEISIGRGGPTDAADSNLGGTLSAVVTGLTVGTAYWFDLTYRTSAGTLGVKDVTYNVIEI